MHQIASFKTTFSKKLLLLRGAHPPSDTPLRRASATAGAYAPFFTSKIWPPPTLNIVPPPMLSNLMMVVLAKKTLPGTEPQTDAIGGTHYIVHLGMLNGRWSNLRWQYWSKVALGTSCVSIIQHGWVGIGEEVSSHWGMESATRS